MLLVKNLVWFAAGMVTGLTSIGGNLVAIPIISLLAPARAAIVVASVAGPVMSCGLALIYRKHILWKESLCLAIAGMCGIPPGIYFLSKASPATLLLSSGICVAIFLIWHFPGSLFFRTESVSILGTIPLGFVSGLMMGSTGMGGPFLAIYAFLRQWDIKAALANIQLVCALYIIPMLPFHYNAGLYGQNELLEALLAGLVAIAGVIAAMPISSRVDTELFRKLLLGMIMFSACTLFARAYAA